MHGFGWVFFVRMAEHAYTEDGKKVDKSLTGKVWKVFREVEMALDDIEPESIDATAELGQYMEDLLEKRLQEFPPNQHEDIRALFTCMMNYLSFHSGADLDKVSLKYVGCFRELDGKNVKLPKGFSSVVDAIAQNLPSDAIHFNTKVEKINYSYTQTNTVKITCQTPSGKSVFEASHVIFTCSLGVLESSHSDMFEPTLPPSKVNSIEAMGFGTVDKIFLKWETPFWKIGEGSLKLAWKGKRTTNRKTEWYRSLFGFDEILNNDNTLVGWIHGEAAEHLETLTDRDVMDQCVLLIRQFLGDPSIPAPTEILRSAWKSNELTRGSYSFLAPSSAPSDIARLAKPVSVGGVPVLLLAGEATHPCFFSTTHGARESGIREAKRLEDYYITKRDVQN